MKVYLGADHAGFQLKEEVKTFLRTLGYTIEDQGAFSLDQNDDYPDYMWTVAKQVAANPESRGILFGGSGQGEAMVANRLPSVRAAVYCGGPEEAVHYSRTDNDSNILSVGVRFVDGEITKRIIKEWLTTDFSGEERHIRRIAKIDGKSGDLLRY